MRLAIDADEVLWACLECFLGYHNQRFGTGLRVADFYTYNWWEVIGCTRQEAVDRYREFHTSGAGYHMVPEEGAFDALSQIRVSHSVAPVVITSRLAELETETRHLLARHYPSIFEAVYFTSHFGAQRKTKSEVCREVGVTMLVEDQLAHALDCAAAGIDVLLFGEYAWNKPTEALPSNVVPVATWSDVLRELGLR